MTKETPLSSKGKNLFFQLKKDSGVGGFAKLFFTKDVKEAVEMFIKDLKAQEKANCGSLYLNDILMDFKKDLESLNDSIPRHPPNYI